MKQQLLFSLLITSLICLSACREQAIEDFNVPEIIITSPIEGSTMISGESMSIQVSISDDVELHSYSLTVFRVSSSSSWVPEYEEEKLLNGKMIDITASFTPEEKLDPTTYVVQIIAGDHSGNNGSAGVSVEVLP